MMEPNLVKENELIQQLKKLRAEKELLEKHVFLLNDCLNLDELKSKISDLEKKKEMLVTLENMIVKLRTEIEPLNYLKSILENKLVENQTKEFDLVPSQMSCKEVFNIIQSSDNSNSMSIINDGSIDECMQLLDQYDVVTDQELINFTSENHSNTQCIEQDLTTSTLNNIDNEVQNNEIASVSTNVNVKDINSELKNDECTPVKENVELNLESNMNNFLSIDPKNCVNYGTSISQSGQNQNILHPNPNVNIADLLLKIPQMLLQEGINESGQNQNILHPDSNVNIADLLLKVPQMLLQEGINAIKTEGHNESIETTECNKSSNSRNLETNTFNDMNLKIDILRGIYSLGLINPTALQKRIIPHILNGQNIVVFAGPGNGRIMMFIIPLLQRIKPNLNDCQALVIVPTQEIALHIQKIIISVGEFLNINVFIGGENVPKKMSAIPHIIIGTPAGISNMIKWNSSSVAYVETIVLYKADQMLTINDIQLIKRIMAEVTDFRQITMLASNKLENLLDIYMDSLVDPLVIINDEKIKDHPKQFYLNIQEEWKFNAVCEIIETLKIEQVVIFCNTLDRAKTLYNSLQKIKYSVSLFHVELSESIHEQTLNMFSSNDLRIIVTTDPVKGNQFKQVTWLINYDLPITPIIYLDRITQCRENGENIKVLNLINDNDEHSKVLIETYSDSCMIQVPINLIDILQF